MKHRWIIIALVLVMVLMASCAPGPNTLIATPNEAGNVGGFWDGLWHGFITPVTFIISLFSDKVTIYEIHNNGTWYNLGFLIGVIVIFGGGGRGSRVRRPWVSVRSNEG